MKTPKQQLVDVMTILKEQAELNPAGTSFQIKLDLFVECPNYAPLLEKLEHEYFCIDIDQRPDERGLSEADHEIFAMEQPKNYARYMSYFITLKQPSFEGFYELETGVLPSSDNDIEGTDLKTDVLLAITRKSMGKEDGDISIAISEFDAQDVTYDLIKSCIEQLAVDQVIHINSMPKKDTETSPFIVRLTDKQKETNKLVKDELERLRTIQMLMIYFGKICQVYDTVASGDIGFDDGHINRMYLLLTIRFERLLEQKGFEQLREQKPDIYETLMGNYEDIDMAYEFLRPELWNFYGKLERLWLEAVDGLGAFELKQDEQKLLDDTDGAISAHRKHKTKLNAAFDKKLDEISARYNSDAAPAKPSASAKSLSSPLGYDDEHGVANYMNKEAHLFSPNTVMGLLMSRIVNADGARITSTDIILHIEATLPELDKELNTKSLTNAKDRINKRLDDLLNISDAVCYERENFWLNHAYCSLNSPYKPKSSGN